jgi:hypothetical protein
MEWAMQLELLAQGRGLDEWGDVLVLVVMAALWLVGALAKVLTSRKGAARQGQQQGPAGQAGPQRETWQQRLARKVHEIQRAAEAEKETVDQQPRTRTAGSRTAQSPSAPPGTVTVRTDEKGDSVMVYQRPAASIDKPAIRQPQAREALSAASQQAPKGPSTLFEPAQSVGFQPDALIDPNDPDALQKAILHYEIFGKPLAMRKPSEEMTLF